MVFFNVTEIAFPGGGNSYAFGVNNSGVVAGTGDNGAGLTAFLYGNGLIEDLGSLGAPGSAAYDVNDFGQAVGYATTDDGHQHAFFYGGGAMQDLGTLGGDNSWAVAINSKGQVVGASETQPGQDTATAFIYEKGQMQAIGNPVAGGEACDINESGDALVLRNVPESGVYVYSSASNTVTDVLSPSSPFSDADFWPNSINDDGQAFGVSSWSGGPPPFTDFFGLAIFYENNFTKVSPMTSWSFPAQPSPPDVQLFYYPVGAINAFGTVTGTCQPPNDGYRAFIWDPNNGLMFLNDLIAGPPRRPQLPRTKFLPIDTIDVAMDINAYRQIVGWREPSGSAPARALRLDPVLKALPPNVRTIELDIIAGLIGDGSGLVLPGGPIDPHWGELTLSPSAEDILEGVRLNAMAGRIRDQAAREQIEQVSVDLVRRSAEALARPALPSSTFPPMLVRSRPLGKFGPIRTLSPFIQKVLGQPN